MEFSNTEYKGFTIEKRTDVISHCCTIYKGEAMVKMIAGDIAKDGSENSIEKAKGFIDSL